MAAPKRNPEVIAQQIVQRMSVSPQLRVKPFENAEKAVAEAAPGKGPLGLAVDSETRELREKVLTRVVTKLQRGREREEFASSVRAETVMQEFFGASMRNPEWTFWSILGLSLGTFVVGVALISTGLAIAVGGDDSTRDTVMASVLGGGGVVGALGSVYTLTTRGVSMANARHAQIRLVLADFATELGHLRALVDFRKQDNVVAVNERIHHLMTHAVELIQTQIKRDPTCCQPKPEAAPSEQKPEGSDSHS